MTLAADSRRGAVLSQDLLQAVYRLLAAALICAGLALASDAFLTLGNILNVLRQTALLFLMASGLTLVILTAGLDLSVGANIGLSACLAASVIQATGWASLGVACGIGCGALIGLANGALVAWLRIPSFIATYGMMWMLTGMTYYYMAGETIHGFPLGFRQFGSGYLLGIPIPVYVMVFFLALGTLFAQRTVWGQQIYALGANAEAARLSGVPTGRRLLLVYAFSGAMAGLASLIILARINSAEGDIGENLTLPAIAAALIGGTSLFGGSGTVSGTLIGALILTLVVNGMNLLQINASWQPLATGLIILVAVGIDMQTRRTNT
ncbi:MAG TPA: ABC transporter permease [Xanthobacteraceae bacterium]|nr:ABC transporter permease [Xanthobacteraceae bacterium]